MLPALPCPALPCCALQAAGGKLEAAHFTHIKELGAGDAGKVDLVELAGTGHQFALKSLDKRDMLARNKVGGCLWPGHAGWLLSGQARVCLVLQPSSARLSAGGCAAPACPSTSSNARTRALLQAGRVRTELTILQALDHPFLVTLYATLQTGAWAVPAVPAANLLCWTALPACTCACPSRLI